MTKSSVKQRREVESDASVLDSLTGTDDAVVLRAIRKVKNQIIGNKQKKLMYTRQGAIPRVVELLKQERSKELRIQAAVALASFSYASVEGSRALNQQHGVEHLLSMLSSSDGDVVQAGARALKMIFHVRFTCIRIEHTCHMSFLEIALVPGVRWTSLHFTMSLATSPCVACVVYCRSALGYRDESVRLCFEASNFSLCA